MRSTALPTACVDPDLGVFDPEGFRGYSGDARKEFVVTPHAATPGYLPGPLVPGQWQVLIGPYRVPPEGIDATLRIETGTTWLIHDRGGGLLAAAALAARQQPTAARSARPPVGRRRPARPHDPLRRGAEH